ncbi:hypothetical protein HGRIS_014504 [Hohenbuehelia grisea]|uniref:O-methyltransferase C-terminal domain-containing protein n=1 Tax=Hohenbuehelia grisea TaxID=104357 RepID=A0ABR3JVE9_9AGAR
MTFADLRALHELIGKALQEIEDVYVEQSSVQASPESHDSPSPTPTPSPLTPSSPCHPVYPFPTSLASFSNSRGDTPSDLHSIIEASPERRGAGLRENGAQYLSASHASEGGGRRSVNGEGSGLGAPILLKSRKSTVNLGAAFSLGNRTGSGGHGYDRVVERSETATRGAEAPHRDDYASPPPSPSIQESPPVPTTPGTPTTRMPKPSIQRTPKSLRPSKSLALLSQTRPYQQADYVSAGVASKPPRAQLLTPPAQAQDSTMSDPSTPPEWSRLQSHDATSDSDRPYCSSPPARYGTEATTPARHTRHPFSPKSPLESVFTFPSARSRSTPATPDEISNASIHVQNLEFPSLDAVYDPNSPAEILNATHPTVMAAISRIVAAAGQMAASVQTPFMTICDAVMGYNLASCMRVFEASHTAEMLRDAGPSGKHVRDLAKRCSIDPNKLAHILRLLATHHIIREVTPDVFALNRISSLVDSGKEVDCLLGKSKDSDIPAEQGHNSEPRVTQSEASQGRTGHFSQMEFPEKKYENTNGIAAFVGMCTDELFKSSAYMTEAYLFSQETKFSREPVHAPFNFAFGTANGFFSWLEEEDTGVATPREELGAETGPGSRTASMIAGGKGKGAHIHRSNLTTPAATSNERRPLQHIPSNSEDLRELNRRHAANRFRLERFGKAMVGTGSWEAPGAVLNGFGWGSLPPGSTIVDVGGGIGSTSMLLAQAFSAGPDDGGDLRMKFIIQDRPVVVEMGEKAWRARCPELLDSGTAQFQVHDFFTPQPIRDAAVFLLRVILHDWPDAYARSILSRLREAATNDTKLIIADFVLPLACADDFGIRPNDIEGTRQTDSTGASYNQSSSSPGEARHWDGVDADQITDNLIMGVEGARRTLAPAPLLANLGKASANAYWMDLTMQVTFNSQERTLREIVALALSAGWKVVKVTHAAGSLFGHIVAVPVPFPSHRRAEAGHGSVLPGPVGGTTTPKNDGGDLGASAAGSGRAIPVPQQGPTEGDAVGIGSRCGTPTFGSRLVLPSIEDTLSRFGGRAARGKSLGVAFGRSIPRPIGGKSMSHYSTSAVPPHSPLAGPSTKVKHRPSPLSFPPPIASLKALTSRIPPSPSISRRSSFANMQRYAQSQSQAPSPVHENMTSPRQTPPIVPRPRSSTLTSRQSTPIGRQTPSSPTVHRQAPPVPPVPALPRLPPTLPVPMRHPLPASPNTSRNAHPTITRRLSQATLVQGGQRKRATSIISGNIGNTSSNIGGIVGFPKHEHDGEEDVHAINQARTSFAPSPGVVLAAAAQIESGKLKQPSS